MTDNQNPPYGPGGYPGQPQPGYPQQPPQGPPPGYGPPPQGVPPQGPPPGYGQPPYGGQPGQPGYPGQPYGGQPGYPPQGQWNQGGPGGPAGWGPGGAPAPRKSNSQLLVLAIGGFVVVAIIGAVLAFTLNRGGDENEADPGPVVNSQPTKAPTTDPSADPSTDPTTDPSGDPTAEPTASTSPEPTDGPDGNDVGMDAGNGVFVRPMPGYRRATPKGVTGVYLKKDGQGAFWVQTGKGSSADAASVLTQAINAEKKGMTNWEASTPKVDTPPAGRKTKITKLTSMTWTAEITGQNGTVKLVGYIGVIERSDNVLTLARFYALRSAADQAKIELQGMMASVVQSQ